MNFKELPNNFKLAEETEDTIWIHPIREDGTYSTEKIKLVDKGKQTNSHTFINVALTIANAHLNAALILKEESTKNSHLLLPASMQTAFACEIYLKYLIFLKNKNNIQDVKILKKSISGDKHNLDNLYQQLTNFMDINYKIQEKLPQNITIADFKRKLVLNANFFKEYRYGYEFNSFYFDFDFLIWFADTLMTICKNELKI